MLLIIDDDPDSVAIIRAIVPSAWTVLSAANGLSGLDLVRRCQVERTTIDLIILDIQLPGLDGYDTGARLRELVPATPILPYSGVSLADHPLLSAYATELGCAPLLSKSCRPETLLEHIQEALEHHPSSQQSGLLMRLQLKAAEAERASREEHAPRVLVYAPDPLVRRGLLQLVEQADLFVVGSATSRAEAQRLVASNVTQAIVAAAADSAASLAIAQQVQLPVVLISPTAAVASALATLVGEGCSVLATTPDAAVQLGAAVATAVTGQLVDAPNSRRMVQNFRHTATQIAIDQVPLTRRERELLAIDGPGSSVEELAAVLKVAPRTIREYRWRIRRKLADAQERIHISSIGHSETD
jgi:DNA-binding NarL/FixJ family response regulator